jgi:hypothetical protein
MIAPEIIAAIARKVGNMPAPRAKEWKGSWSFREALTHLFVMTRPPVTMSWIAPADSFLSEISSAVIEALEEAGYLRLPKDPKEGADDGP